MYDRLSTSVVFWIVASMYVNYDNVDRNNNINLGIAYLHYISHRG